MLMSVSNSTGKHRPKRRHHGAGTVVLRKDRWRAKPWAAVVPYIDPSGRRREMWLSASSRAEAEGQMGAAPEAGSRKKVERPSRPEAEGGVTGRR